MTNPVEQANRNHQKGNSFRTVARAGILVIVLLLAAWGVERSLIYWRVSSFESSSARYLQAASLGNLESDVRAILGDGNSLKASELEQKSHYQPNPPEVKGAAKVTIYSFPFPNFDFALFVYYSSDGLVIHTHLANT